MLRVIKNNIKFLLTSVLKILATYLNFFRFPNHHWGPLIPKFSPLFLCLFECILYPTHIHTQNKTIERKFVDEDVSSYTSLSWVCPLVLVYKIYAICCSSMKENSSQHCDNMISFFVHKNNLRQSVFFDSPVYAQGLGLVLKELNSSR